jgi:hypothetical protein
MRSLVARFILIATVAACGSPVTSPAPSQTISETPSPETGSPQPTRAPTTLTKKCQSTDQDRDVYHPARLQVLAPCLRVSGTVAAVRHEADGDRHILLALDPQFSNLLRPANQGVELGDLVVEPVCVGRVTQADAIAICAADPDPLNALPTVGMRVWMEGRYVLDLQHGGWAELHPLYRWGLLP